MESSQVNHGPRHQGSKPSHEIQQLEDDVGSAISIRRLQLTFIWIGLALRDPTLSSSGGALAERSPASSISLLSSGDAAFRWDQVGPERYCCQANCFREQDRYRPFLHARRIKALPASFEYCNKVNVVDLWVHGDQFKPLRETVIKYELP
jgi:hypothetical protein